MFGRGRSQSGAHRWAFTRIGGVDQVLLRDGRDVEAVSELDLKIWAALAMPRKAAGVLPETLSTLDSHGDGRIRAPEVMGAVRFCSANLVSLDELFLPGESLETANLRPGPLADTVRWLLEAEGKPLSARIDLDDARKGASALAASRFNGDGVLPADSARDEGVAALVRDMIAAGYGVAGLGGAVGVSKAGLEAFLADSTAWLRWSRAGRSDPSIAPLGEATAAAWSSTQAIRAKLDDFFLRASLAAVAGSAGGAAWGQEARLAALLASGIRKDSPELLALPLASTAPAGTLDLEGAVNPGWAEELRAFARAVAPLRGAGSRLDAAEWERIKSALAPYGAWLSAQPAGKIGSLGEQRLDSIERGDERVRLAALIAEDQAWGDKRQQIADVVRLLLYRRDLLRILRNFVNFSDFYGKRDAAFQAGRLYLDGREFELCLEVDNPAAHPTLAAMSSVYLVYCGCSRTGGQKKSIVAALTAGEAGNLFVGKNGVFYDREGNDWDARVERIQVQPISIREAFFSPYRWIARTIEDLVAKRAAAAEASSLQKLKAQAEGAVTAVTTTGTATPAAKLDLSKRIDVGTVAAIGVALGSIGATVTGVLTAFAGMGVWMPIGIVSVFLLISGPSVLLAYLKLRRRNLGPILDAEGWAINGRLKLNAAFGATLTRLAALPPGSERRFEDPFATRRRPWGLYLVILGVLVLLVLWLTGALDAILPQAIRAGRLFRPEPMGPPAPEAAGS